MASGADDKKILMRGIDAPPPEFINWRRLRSVRPANFGDRSMTIRKSKAQLDEELNEALKETFPGSDPVAIDASTDKPIRPIGRRPPGIDKALVEDLARKVRKSHARSRPH